MPKTMTARSAAAYALTNILKNSKRADVELSSIINEISLSQKDKSLVSAIVYGVIQNICPIDNVINILSERPENKISDNVKNILRCAVYQKQYMDKIPDYAIVNEAVKAAEMLENRGAALFVNAVLRAFISGRKLINDPIYKDTWDEFRYKFSLSRDIIDLWRKSYGDDTAKMLSRTVNDDLPTVIRINTLKGTVNHLEEKILDDGIEIKKTWPEMAYYANINSNPMEKQSFKNGLFVIQDKGSQLAIEALRPKEGESIIDLCSAPGGKSAAAASAMNNTGKIFCFDVTNQKLNLIKECADRCGVNIMDCSVSDSTRFNEKFEGVFDAAICDVPCSGLGTIQQKPDIRFKTTDEIENLYDIQLKILTNASRYVRRGGRVLYSTCTLNKKENEDIILKFLKNNTSFELEDVSDLLFKYGIQSQNNKMVTLMPHIHGCAGFFLCILKNSV